MPEPIRNRFFVSAESNKNREVVFDEFFFQAERGAEMYRKVYDRAIRTWPQSERRLVSPEKFLQFLARDRYKGVSGERVSAGLNSAGGMSNVPMEIAYKEALLESLEDANAITVLRRTSVMAADESESSVNLEVKSDGATRRINARHVVLTAAHGITALTGLLHGSDLSGAYHLNFMLHVDLPATDDPVLRDYLASVNFVLQGVHGGMYACVVPPTEHEAGVAALFAPGYDASYVDEYLTNAQHTPALGWDELIQSAAFPGRSSKVKRVIDRVIDLNPFLGECLRRSPSREPRVVVGSVFNPHGEIRSLRRLTLPTAVSGKGRVLAMTSPKWTTVELAALTLLQELLKVLTPKHVIESIDGGFGPQHLNLAAAASRLLLPDVQFHRSRAERYLTERMLTHRILPETHRLFT